MLEWLQFSLCRTFATDIQTNSAPPTLHCRATKTNWHGKNAWIVSAINAYCWSECVFNRTAAQWRHQSFIRMKYTLTIPSTLPLNPRWKPGTPSIHTHYISVSFQRSVIAYPSLRQSHHTSLTLFLIQVFVSMFLFKDHFTIRFRFWKDEIKLANE